MENLFEVQISEHGLEAHVSVMPGRSSSREELVDALSEAGVRKGLIDAALDALADNLTDPNFSAQNILVAQGEAPREGSDGKLELSLSPDIPASHVEAPAKKGEESLGYFSVVVPRMEIGSYQEPRAGEPGWNVSGEEVQCADVADPLERIGDGLECTPNGKILATVVGIVIAREDEVLQVRPLPSDKRILVTVIESSMTARIRVFPGEPGDADTLGIALERAGVVHGVTSAAEALLAENLPDPLFRVEDLVAAQGTAPIAGADGFFTPRFAAEAPAGLVSAGKVDDEGQIDFWNRSLLVPVEQNQVLGVYTKPTVGTPGMNVSGEELPAENGTEQMPTLGDGVDQKNKSETILAGRAGVISYQEAKSLDVVDASEHRGDVDLKSGNLRASGSIMITGNVTRNARVSATGDIVIKGLVDGGGVASDGQVAVAGGVIGQDKAWIRARGDVTCKHTQGARIECRETLEIQKSATNSWLQARVVSGSFRVLGGEIQAAEKISIQEAGSPFGARTVLAVAMSLPLCEEESCHNVELAFRTECKVPPPSAKDAGPMNDHKEINSETRRLLLEARIEVAGTVHPGVVVQFDRFSTTINEALKGVSFRYDESSSPPIVIESLNP